VAIETAMLFYVSCDRCGTANGKRLYSREVHSALSKARTEGWQIKMGAHMCPKCLELLKLFSEYGVTNPGGIRQ